MKSISEANSSVLSILKTLKKDNACSRLFRYTMELELDDGTLLYNLLTNELLLLTAEEYTNICENDYLKQHWFVVPKEIDDREYVDLVKWLQRNMAPKKQPIIHYTIFTTLDCNARCFYCYELGCNRIPMSEETALKAVQFIKKHCQKNKVTLNWYGGEPLYNAKVIDTICDGLNAEGIPFRSVMISNGYLFNDELARKAVEKWNLEKIQITLDGTEAVYNKIKAFIHREGSAYQIVLANIARLLDAGIKVSIRMNLDLHNADDLLNLIDDLANRFDGNKLLSAYAYHIFKGIDPIAELHDENEWKVRDEAMLRINKKLTDCGLSKTHGIRKILKSNHCMADSGNAVTILPNGEIGLCDHHNSDEFIGHVDSEVFNDEVIESWKERVSDSGAECGECFYYPACTMLKKCGTHSICYEQYRKERTHKIQNAMLNEYEQWKEKNILSIG